MSNDLKADSLTSSRNDARLRARRMRISNSVTAGV